jgi:hypothetical protein
MLLTFMLMFNFREHIALAMRRLRVETCSCPIAKTPESNIDINTHIFLRSQALEDMGPQGDHAWNDLTTEKGGFLWVQYNETLNLRYGISMFHGLHCLQMLRSEFQQSLGLVDNGGKPIHDHQSKRRLRAKRGEDTDAPDPVHLGHCLSYVAMVCKASLCLQKHALIPQQMLRCAGDSTIEQPLLQHDDATGTIISLGIDGDGAQHQCRDTKHLRAIAESSERKAVEMWDYRPGDTVESVPSLSNLLN